VSLRKEKAQKLINERRFREMPKLAPSAEVADLQDCDELMSSTEQVGLVQQFQRLINIVLDRQSDSK
jgi:hypothetical protein